MIERQSDPDNSTAPGHPEPQWDNTTYCPSPGTILVGDPYELDKPKATVMRGWRVPAKGKGPRHRKPKRKS